MKKTWWKESVVYQIYPRSFCDSNGDGIGDLKGITSKLDYLKELGVDVIWLSPVYQSPNDDNGYDISDYQAIMKEFGTMDDFDEMLEEAHKRGLKIMMDLVVNHSSDEHKWFQESRKGGEDNPYKDYYIWRETPVNKWESYFEGSVWEYDEMRKMYYLHLFSKKQPDLNWDNPAVRQEVYKMMTWWLEKGIDGFRMDVINLISKKEGLPDGKPMEGRNYTENNEAVVCGPHFHEYLQEMNREVLSKYDIMTVGECICIDEEQGKLITEEDRHELNMVFQFEHVDVGSINGFKWTTQPYSLVELKSILNKWQIGLNEKGWNSLYMDNHDQPRMVSRFGNDGMWREESAKMLATCLHLMKGTPYIFQGEELGMTNVKMDSLSEYRDIESLNAYKTCTEELGYTHEYMMECLNQKSRDNARTPMQWDTTENGGFTTGTPWIKVNPNYTTINAKQQVQDEASVFHYYKELINLRHHSELIVYGDFEMLYPEDEKLFVYRRYLGDEQMLVICNYSQDQIDFQVPECFEGKQGEWLIGNYAPAAYSEQMTLKPYEARVYCFK